MDTKQKRRPASSSGTRRKASSGGSAGAASQARRPAAPRQSPGSASASRRAPAETQRRQSGTGQPQRQATKRRSRPAPQIVYTQPKPFSRNRLLLRLATTVAVVLALTFGISIFFKVSTITVSGTEKYTAWDVREASGIQEGENLLTFGKGRARVRILAELPYVKDVRIGIKLPDTVNIVITELDVVYAIRDQSGSWWLITSDGNVVEQTDSATAGQYTQILGIQLSLPRAGEQAVAMEPVSAPSSTEDSAVTVPVTARASEQLSAALSILQYLEENGIIGEMASVDVTDLSQIELWYGQRYQVKLGDTTQLSRKIRYLNAAINGENGLSDFQSGVLDISFTIWPEGVGYTPFT